MDTREPGKRRIINGKLYDTETAAILAKYCKPGSSWNDPAYYEETLYRKVTGEYFIFCEGGAATFVASRYGGQPSDGGNGWDIFPYTEAGARQWAEYKTDADTYITIFGPVPE